MAEPTDLRTKVAQKLANFATAMITLVIIAALSWLLFKDGEEFARFMKVVGSWIGVAVIAVPQFAMIALFWPLRQKLEQWPSARVGMIGRGVGVALFLISFSVLVAYAKLIQQT